MPRIDKREKNIAWAVASVLGVIIVVTAFFTLWGEPLFDDYLFYAVIIIVFPPAVLDYVDKRWKEAINNHLPDLFLNIIQAKQTGMTLPQALEEAAKRDYGPLTQELKKLVNQMSWGLSFEDALHKFDERIDTPLVHESIPLIIEASHSGGRVEKVFKPISRFTQTILTMKKERKAQTRPYIAIIYVAFYVFVFTIILLFKTFFVEMSESPVVGLSTLTAQDAWRIFFYMTCMQGFFGGLVAGKMGEGELSAGLKHIVILMISGYVALKLGV
jgi:flagellar protein FlaJ